MDSFDFPAIPSLNKTMVLELARCGFFPVSLQEFRFHRMCRDSPR
jgi:hypothetical protein